MVPLNQRVRQLRSMILKWSRENLEKQVLGVGSSLGLFRATFSTTIPTVGFIPEITKSMAESLKFPYHFPLNSAVHLHYHAYFRRDKNLKP